MSSSITTKPPEPIIPHFDMTHISIGMSKLTSVIQPPEGRHLTALNFLPFAIPAIINDGSVLFPWLFQPIRYHDFPERANTLFLLMIRFRQTEPIGTHNKNFGYVGKVSATINNGGLPNNHTASGVGRTPNLQYCLPKLFLHRIQKHRLPF